jgi:hypothetical protein
MLSRDVTAYPFGGITPQPGPPYHTAMDQPAGLSGMPPASRFAGQQDTLTLTGPVGAGDEGYMGRDLSDPASQPTLNEGRGMFGRLHEGG